MDNKNFKQYDDDKDDQESLKSEVPNNWEPIVKDIKKKAAIARKVRTLKLIDAKPAIKILKRDVRDQNKKFAFLTERKSQ